MRRKDIRELVLEENVVNKIMYLHQIDTEKNKKILFLKDRAIQRVARKLEDADACINNLNKEIKKYESINLTKLETMDKELKKMKKEKQIQEIIEKIKKVNALVIEDITKEMNKQNEEIIVSDAFIPFLNSYYIKWLKLLLIDEIAKENIK